MEPYAVYFSMTAVDALDIVPDHVKEMVWSLLETAQVYPYGFQQWDEADSDGRDVRLASVGQLYLTYWVNQPLHRLSVLSVVWYG
ncbi:hypothetical protein ADK75_06165 [Streptomyces virginiae]|uniref:Uncharacterized protein n=1 Tax=Streptomyces virginiae TaxID=1961 RepID=A0A0L8N2X8_STRVG|nr:hypothetical protein [Streptomyces virginiae]KOG56895.1 hypothetical protein ADK75_06165 [Streptomyces virginiae]